MAGAEHQRAADMHALANKLNDMEAHVYHTAEAASYRDRSAGGHSAAAATVHGEYYEGGSAAAAAAASNASYILHGGEADGVTEGAALALALGPTVDPAVLPIAEGRLFRKEGGLTGRAWKERWVRVEGATLAFYARAGDTRPRDRLSLAPGMILSRPSKAHRNRAVKFDFDISLEGAELPVELYSETEEAGIAWMTSITYMVRRLEDVLHAAETGMLPGEADAHAERVHHAAGTDFNQADANNAHHAASSVTPSPHHYHDYEDHAASQPSGYAPSSSFPSSMSAQVSHKSATAMVVPLQLSLHHHDAATLQWLQDAAQCHSAFGSGLFEAVRGETASFSVQLNELTGSQRSHGGDDVTFALVCGASGLRFDFYATDNGDGSYYAEYTPSRAGAHTLHVFVDGLDIYGSPFFPTVEGAHASAGACTLSGEGTRTAHAGIVNTVIITAGDAFGEPRGVGGDVFVASVPPQSPALLRSIYDQGDGTYVIEYDVDTEHPTLAHHAAGIDAPVTVEIHVALNTPGFPYPRPVAGGAVRAMVSFNGSGGGPRAAGTGTGFVGTRVSPQAVVRNAAAAAAAAATGYGSNAQFKIAAYASEGERTVAERLAAVDEERRSLDEQRAVVQQQVSREGELSRDAKRQAQSASK